MASVAWSLPAERELWTDICAPRGAETHPDALYWFVRIAWGVEWFFRGTGKRRWFVDRVHKPFLRWLQGQVLAWKANRQAGGNDLWLVGVVLPRGFGKTVTATKAAALWSHLDEPNMTTALGSEVHPKAKDFLKPIKEVLVGNSFSWFAWLYGSWDGKAVNRAWADDRIEHAYRGMTALSEPSFDTFGTEKGITGYHPLMVVQDDPLSATKLRQEGGAWLVQVKKAFGAIFKAVSTDGFIMLVGTRYLIDDVIGDAISFDKGEGVATWDGMACPHADVAEHVGKGKWHVYFLQGRDRNNKTTFEEGEPVLPEVWTHERMKLDEKKDSADFSAQIMNLPASGEHMPLTQDQIATMRVKRDDLPPIEYATIHCDIAYKDEESAGRGDENVISTWLHPVRQTGIVYFDGAKRSRDWRSEDFLDALVSTCMDLRRRMIRIRVITCDRNPGGQRNLWKNSVLAALGGARLRQCDVVEIHRSEGKNERLRLGASYWVEGYVRLIEDAAERPRLEFEMANIGYVKPKDLGDASVDVFGDEKKGHDWWRKPDFGSGNDPDEGAYVQQPGDDALRALSRPVSTQEMLDRYDEQFPQFAPPEARY